MIPTGTHLIVSARDTLAVPSGDIWTLHGLTAHGEITGRENIRILRGAEPIAPFVILSRIFGVWLKIAAAALGIPASLRRGG
ncbi:MAG: hypothetical protein IJG83_07985 [Thermoguttaceae bacterium]|nr:hypothetical protein [Thermoguttaceae bacterium]MBQ3333346.1 hypothetical protein [Thermoguttaceae bacterium]